MARPTKFDKVVKREICAVTSRGTRVFSVQDGEAIDAGSANYLLAICEEVFLLFFSLVPYLSKILCSDSYLFFHFRTLILKYLMEFVSLTLPLGHST